MLSPESSVKKNTKFAYVRKNWLSTRSAKEVTTYERDKDYCSLYLSAFDDLLITKITALEIQAWVTMLSKKYKPKTVNMAFNLLSQIMAYAVSPLKLIDSNPCKENIQRPKLRKKGIDSDKYWNEAELKFFINHSYTKEDSYYCMYLLHSTFGMRPGEVCGISIYDINLDRQMITLNHGVDKMNRLTNLKNSGAQRTLRIPDSLIQPLKQQIVNSGHLRPKNVEYPYLFVLNNGQSINPDTYCQHTQRLIKRINNSSKDIMLKPITPYGLRHTFATLALIKGIHIKVVAEIMGDSVETVMQNYAHIVEQMSSDSLELMSNIILNNQEKDSKTQNYNHTI